MAWKFLISFRSIGIEGVQLAEYQLLAGHYTLSILTII